MPTKLLLKMPSRQRPEVLLKACHLYADLCADPANTKLLLSLDRNDHTLGVVRREKLLSLRVPVEIVMGQRTNKIGAVNRDLPGAWPWDILAIASDDQWPVVHGYDDIIRRDMATHWPEGDGCLWYHDGHQDRICTQSILDRKYYERTGYVYNYAYSSYRADDEFTEVAVAEGRMAKIEQCIIRHEHHYWNGKVEFDGLYRFNQTFKEGDEYVYDHRKAAGFPR